MMVLLFWLSTACLLVWQCDVFRKVSQFTWRFSSLTGRVQTVPTGERHESDGYNHDRKIASRGVRSLCAAVQVRTCSALPYGDQRSGKAVHRVPEGRGHLRASRVEVLVHLGNEP